MVYYCSDPDRSIPLFFCQSYWSIYWNRGPADHPCAAPEGNKEAVDRLDDDAPGRTPGAPKKEKELTQNANPLKLLASPTGFEPVSPA